MTSLGNEPLLQERKEQPYVSISIKATLKEWGKVNALLPEVFGWLAKNRIAPAGAPFFRYWVTGDQNREFDLEVGVPVSEPVEGDGRVKAGATYAGKYLTYLHHGHPDQLEHLHNEMMAWAAQHGMAFKWQGREGVWSGFYQFYLTNPAEEPDLNRWKTEIAYQVKDDTVCQVPHEH